ncbi:MAG: 50S ribosomal protein L11 methyltransferase [Saprospiraceae bacterium]|nr:50S ribosomal protein L11 methyltransferase [Saprospiraceae bacterium]
MDYIQYNISCPLEMRDILVALLSEHPFDTFEEVESSLLAYIPAHAENREVKKYVEDLVPHYQFQYERTFIPAQNWNEVWESNFQPIQVGQFCGVRAVFHTPFEDVQHELIIQPKMAFGTGHHATTYQVLEMMSGLDFQDKHVLDYGCGTGILAILAAKLGALSIDAIDVDEWAYENTLENIAINHTPHIRVHQGMINQLETRCYDIILANITLNVISSSLLALYRMLPANGYLITSGFFEEDIPTLQEMATTQGFSLLSSAQKERWACALFKRV